MPYESPSYEVESRLDDVELRRYEPYVVAETTVDAPLERAGNGGFRVLAGYIFGGNRTEDGGSTKIAMTTPVTQDRVADGYRLRFMMPADLEPDDLPTPTDDRVRIDRVDARVLAALRYGGSWSRSGYERHLARLQDTLSAHGYRAVGEPIWARYDPPWKPWFLRRNEVLTEVEGADGSAIAPD